MKKITLFILVAISAVGCKLTSNDKDNNSPINNKTVLNDSLQQQNKNSEYPVPEEENFTDYLEKIIAKGNPVNPRYKVLENYFGIYGRSFSYSFSFRNINEAFNTFKKLNMLELDDYCPDNSPQSSGRKIAFDFELQELYDSKFIDEHGSVAKTITISGKEVTLSIVESPENKNSKLAKETTYTGNSSTLKTFDFEGEKETYADRVTIKLTHEANHLTAIEFSSTLNGYMSDDQLLTKNPDNQMTLEELIAADKEVENTVYAICNGYTSSFKLKKIKGEMYELTLAITTPYCAL